MQNLKTIKDLPKGTVLAMGTFDGLHLGHQQVIKCALKEAKQRGVPAGVFTFANHPFAVLHPEHIPREIISHAQKEKLLARAGLDYLLEVTFDEQFAALSPEQFTGQLAAFKVVVGDDFRFGRNGQGSGRDFQDVMLCPKFCLGGLPVSSTRIRGLLGEGNLQEAEQLLGRKFSLIGRVQHGEQRGRLLGFPTANLSFGNYVIPKFGVYAVDVQIGAKKYAGMGNVGDNPTFGQVLPRLEVHIFNFQGDLYGQTVEIVFQRWLREEKKFASIGDLCRQLAEDEKKACTFL